MSKRMSLKEEDEVVSEPLTHVSIGVYKEESTGEWHVAKFMFNPKTGQSELKERIPAGPGRDFAIEKFKIVAVAEGVVG